MIERTFEDRIFDAVVDRFFQPEWISTMVWDQQSQMNVPQMVQTVSPVARIASDIFAAKHHEIVEAVAHLIDMDVVAEKIWERIRDDLAQRLSPAYSSIWTKFDKDREALREAVKSRIADELARRALEAMDDGVVP